MPEKKTTSMKCCNTEIRICDLWILQDIKGYVNRKMFVGKCPVCADDVCLQIETSLNTGKTYVNLYNGIEAVKTLYREKKRKVSVLPSFAPGDLLGWIYGKNVEIKNKNKEVVQIRQYATCLKNGNSKLVKKIFS